MLSSMFAASHFFVLQHFHCYLDILSSCNNMSKQKTVIVGAGPVGALAALYAAGRGHEVEVYELRGGMSQASRSIILCI